MLPKNTDTPQIRWTIVTETVPPLPSPATVDLWGIRLNATPTEFYSTLLAPDERDRAARFLKAIDRHRYNTTRGLLRTLLGCYLQQPPATLRFEYTRHGKPLLREHNLHFSVAHSGNLAVLGFAPHPLGVDVEMVQPDIVWRDLAPLVFTAAEQTWISAHSPLDQISAFFTLWSRKEAFLKARGLGFSGDPTAVTLLSDAQGVLRPTPPDPTTVWTIRDVLIAPDYRAAVCYRRPS